MTTRRQFLIVLGTAVPAAQTVSAAQHAKLRRVGVLLNAPSEVMTESLRQLGYVEGKNVLIVRRFAEGNLERLPALAADLSQQNVEVIFAGGTPALTAAKEAAAGRIPIVFANSSDPVGMGFVASLARPGGNITGISNIGHELTAKRLELLKEIFPKSSRVAVFVTKDPIVARHVPEIQRAANKLGIEVLSVELLRRDGVERASAQLSKWRADSMYFLETSDHFSNRKALAEFAAKVRLPAIFPVRQYAEAGGLISYGADYDANYRRAAAFIDRILKGAKPADIPVELPTKFDLVINMKTAEMIGITFPPSVLARADRVIE